MAGSVGRRAVVGALKPGKIDPGTEERMLGSRTVRPKPSLLVNIDSRGVERALRQSSPRSGGSTVWGEG